MNKKRLWYTSSAETFDQTLPIGNGSFGAVIYGKVPREKISLNLDTFWSGSPRKEEKEVPSELLNSIRDQIMRKEYKAAQEKIEKHLLGYYNESYLPFGTFWYEIEGVRDMTGYKRELNLQDAAVSVTYNCSIGTFESTVFASYPDSCIAGRIKIKDGQTFCLSAGIDSRLRCRTEVQGDTISLIMQAPSHVEPNYVASETPIVYDEDRPGMKGICTAWFRIEGKSAGIIQDSDYLRFQNAEAVEFYLAAADGYRGYGKSLEHDADKIKEKNMACIEMLKKLSFEEIKARHLKDYQEIYSRVEVCLEGEDKDELPTDLRLKRFREGEEDTGLYELYFQYNRYLLTASSRKGSQPANLQGIWSESRRPVWSSNWTININTEMNYWLAGPCNLMECYMPLVEMVDELRLAGGETARKQYHCRGFVANHNVDLWRQTSPVAGLAKFAYWPMGGVWLTNQIVDHYRYTKDKEILQNKIYPIVREAALFCMDWMFMGEDGKYHTAPSTSPENTFLDQNGNSISVSSSSTMDIALITELLNNLICISEELECRDELYLQAGRYLEAMPEFRVGSRGQLLEWCEEFPEEDTGHRHFSPLTGFHPGRLINKQNSPELVRACEKTIELRLKNGSGHIGWSCAWLINMYARLGQGEKAFDFLNQLLKNSSYDNLFDLHPPLGENEGEREVFQIDGNLGSAAGFAAMFMQSSAGAIELLPALPRAWKEGSIKGLLAEGCFLVSMEWSNHRLKRAEICSCMGGILKLRCPEKLMLLDEKENILAESEALEELEYLTRPGGRYLAAVK